MRASSWERIPSPPRIGNGKLLNEGQLLINELEAANDGLVGGKSQLAWRETERQLRTKMRSFKRLTQLPEISPRFSRWRPVSACATTAIGGAYGPRLHFLFPSGPSGRPPTG